MSHFVYRCYAADGDLLYVGCSKDVEARLRQHGRNHGSWVPDIARVQVEAFDDRADALRVESEAIATEHPYWNNIGRWGGHATWTEAQYQRWGHMLARHPYPRYNNEIQVRDLRMAYLIRFGKPFSAKPLHGLSPDPIEAKSA